MRRALKAASDPVVAPPSRASVAKAGSAVSAPRKVDVCGNSSTKQNDVGTKSSAQRKNLDLAKETKPNVGTAEHRPEKTSSRSSGSNASSAITLSNALAQA